MFRMDPAASYEEWENERHTRDNPAMPQTTLITVRRMDEIRLVVTR